MYVCVLETGQESEQDVSVLTKESYSFAFMAWPLTHNKFNATQTDVKKRLV